MENIITNIDYQEEISKAEELEIIENKKKAKQREDLKNEIKEEYLKELNREEIKKQYIKDINSCWQSIIYTISQDNNMNYYDNKSYINITDEIYQENKKENDILEKLLISLKIEFKDIGNYAGLAKVTENIIEINKNNESSFARLLIHEFSHVALYHFSNNKNYLHTLEFAIFNYCLFNKYYFKSDDILINKKDNDFLDNQRCFFRAYDIHEDPAYSLLSINVCKFDDLIRSIKFKNLKDLYNKSCIYAEKIRSKAITF
ncbi:MAG TPA: hypothetical protein PL131_09520 [Methylotenera sp.]|nr:hypothetical protein [Methylotenera sp.]HPH06101.1 hypothetical protein [Methylotenera sp.]